MTTVKSTVEEIRARFDNDVERFSNLETGQSATIDAPLVMSLIVQAAATVTPEAMSVFCLGAEQLYQCETLDKWGSSIIP